LMSCPDNRSVDVRTVPDERADDLGRVRAMPWGVRVEMEKPPDVALVVDEKDTRYARVPVDQAVERGHVAVLKSALELDRERGAGGQHLWLLHDTELLDCQDY
jgi:hypothetical protein